MYAISQSLLCTCLAMVRVPPPLRRSLCCWRSSLLLDLTASSGAAPASDGEAHARLRMVPNTPGRGADAAHLHAGELCIRGRGRAVVSSTALLPSHKERGRRVERDVFGELSFSRETIGEGRTSCFALDLKQEISAKWWFSWFVLHNK